MELAELLKATKKSELLQKSNAVHLGGCIGGFQPPISFLAGFEIKQTVGQDAQPTAAKMDGVTLI